MKRLGLIITISLTILSNSCNDFLEVNSDSEVLQKDLFNTINGTRMAVNGVYKSLSQPELYGRNLTWGFVSAIGHNYSTAAGNLKDELFYSAAFDWENKEVKPITEQIWSRAYNVIAEANNILQETENKDDSFFEFGEYEKNMIIGEMYAIRAFMHFDLCRLFCSSPKTNISTRIPYVTKYPDKQPVHVDRDKVLEEIIKDMEHARDLLAPVDTIFCKDWNRSSSMRLELFRSSTPDIFVGTRGYRMNYFSVSALLARIYLYQGNLDKAYENAKNVLDKFNEYLYTWTDPFNQGFVEIIDFIHPKRPNETLLCFYNKENYNNWEQYSIFYPMQMKNMDELFAGESEDFRKVGWYDLHYTNQYLTWLRPNTASIADFQGPLLPIIRMSEIYYILIEYYIHNKQSADAVALFQTVREKRGIESMLPQYVDTFEENTPNNLNNLLDKLIIDIVRETLTEGQTFYLFKRLNRSIFNGDTEIKMQEKDWIIPLPDSETSYQF